MSPKIAVFENKKIILGVTGSIAVYKAVDLASKLTQAGVQVDVIMTEAAQQFVTPLTFQAVTGRPVYTTMWQTDSGGGLPTHIAHVGLAEQADAIVIMPITANTLAKVAHGFADDLLSVTVLGANCPIAIAPAMDGSMYENAAVQHNLRLLIERGYYVITPEYGRFASGLTGLGRLPDTTLLMGEIRRMLGAGGVLKNKKIIVTAGGTQEAIDPVRYITNRSSGKQGYAVAQAALDAGAKQVVLISTTPHLPIPVGANYVGVQSADEMLRTIEQFLPETDALIMAAAVADFRPMTMATQKIKKSSNPDEGLTIQLGRTADILLQVKEIRQQTGFPHVVVGFAAESQDLLTNAQSKLERKSLDMIVANDILASDAGFGVDTNRVIILEKNGHQTRTELLSKSDIGDLIVQKVGALLQSS